VPILTLAGWLDAGTANGVLSQFTSLPNTQQAWLGPWSHGQGYLADPFLPSRPLTAAEHQQLTDQVYAFFDRYVKRDGRPDGRRLLHYYTLNEGTWRTTAQWPVPGTRMRRLDLPTSVLFRPGDRIRLTIAAADPSSFQLLPADGQAGYLIGHSPTQPSFVELPVVR
jgi:predicted acyl esterase